MTSGDAQLDALLDHMREPLPHGHGMHEDSIDNSNPPHHAIRQHQYLHHFEQCTHEHTRPGEGE